MKKESRFWKKGIKVLLAIGLLGSMLVPTSAMANEYVTPGNAEEDDSDKTQVTFTFMGLDDDGSRKVMQSVEKDIKLGTTLKEIGMDFFPVATYKDLKFLGWVDGSGRTVDGDTLIYSTAGNSYYPKFDKVVTSVSFKYLDSSNNIKEVAEPYILEYGATFQDLVNQCAGYRVQDISKEDAFSGWVIDQDYYLKPNETINVSGETVKLKAEFENKKVLEMQYGYYDTNGLSELYKEEVRLIDKNITYENLSVETNKIPLPESFKGLRANGWMNYGIQTGDIKSFEFVYLFPNYENCIVRFLLANKSRPVEEQISTRGAGTDPVDEDFDTVYAVVAEKGDVITIPEMKGYTNIVWLDPKPEGDKLVINKHTSFYGYGDKVDVPVVNPDGDNDNNGTNVPDVTLPEDEINNAVNEVKNAAKGEKVTVDMKDNVTLPVEVLESARGKDVEVVFNMGAYSWSINGLDITADTLKAINLEVKLNANAISADVVKTLAGDRPTMQLSLSHNGEFGFKAKLQFNLGAEHKGKYGNLYYYNKDGKLEFMNAGKIDENGNVSLEFTHASDYVVIIDEKSMEPKKAENPIQDTSSTVGSNGIVGMLILVGLGGTCYLANKKGKAKAK